MHIVKGLLIFQALGSIIIPVLTTLSGQKLELQHGHGRPSLEIVLLGAGFGVGGSAE